MSLLGDFLSLMVLCVVMFVGSLAFGAIPYACTLSPKLLRLVSVFGAGLLVGTSLIVVIPEGVHMLWSDGAKAISAEAAMMKCPPTGAVSVQPTSRRILGTQNYGDAGTETASASRAPWRSRLSDPIPAERSASVSQSSSVTGKRRSSSTKSRPSQRVSPSADARASESRRPPAQRQGGKSVPGVTPNGDRSFKEPSPGRLGGVGAPSKGRGAGQEGAAATDADPVYDYQDHEPSHDLTQTTESQTHEHEQHEREHDHEHGHEHEQENEHEHGHDQPAMAHGAAPAHSHGHGHGHDHDGPNPHAIGLSLASGFIFMLLVDRFGGHGHGHGHGHDHGHGHGYGREHGRVKEAKDGLAAFELVPSTARRPARRSVVPESALVDGVALRGGCPDSPASGPMRALSGSLSGRRSLSEDADRADSVLDDFDDDAGAPPTSIEAPSAAAVADRLATHPRRAKRGPLLRAGSSGSGGSGGGSLGGVDAGSMSPSLGGGGGGAGGGPVGSRLSPRGPRDSGAHSRGGVAWRVDVESQEGMSAARAPPTPSAAAAAVAAASSDATLLGLLIHSAVDGVALGASAVTGSGTTGLSLVVFLAIMLHKGPAAFGLSSFLLQDRLPRSVVMRKLVYFAGAAPIGAVLTFIALAGGIVGHSRTTVAHALLFSAGTFLFVATMHILPEVQARAKSHTMELSAVIALVAGAFTPALISVEHEH